MTDSAVCDAGSLGESAVLVGAADQALAPDVTLLDLVTVVRQYAESEAELIATVVYMVNSGSVRLCGSFKGARFDLSTFSLRRPAARCVNGAVAETPNQ